MYHNMMNKIYCIIGFVLLLFVVFVFGTKMLQSEENFVHNNCGSCIQINHQRKPDSNKDEYFKTKDWYKYKYFNKYRQCDVFQIC